MNFTVSELTAWVGGKVANSAELGSSLDQIAITRVAPLASARSSDISFFFSKEYQQDLMRSSPGVLVTAPPFVKPLQASGLPLWKKSAVLVSEDPYWAMAKITEKFAMAQSPSAHQSRPEKTMVHPTAVVSEEAELGAQVKIGPHVVVEKGARIGAGSVLYPGCYVGPAAVIGEDCVLFPRVTIYENTQIGSRVRIHAGTVIGADGFGYAPIREPGGQVKGHQKIYHFGKVVIEDDVEIGANTCVDRGTLSDTIIRKHAKIDNHVQIGHNVLVDEGAVVCGSTGIAGSAVIGKFAYVGGHVGVSNKMLVGERASVGGCSLVAKDVPAGTTHVGNPARDKNEHFRIQVLLNKMLRDRGRK